LAKICSSRKQSRLKRRLLWSKVRFGRSWPLAPVDRHWRNGRSRGIAAVGSAALNGSKGSSPAGRDRRVAPFRHIHQNGRIISARSRLRWAGKFTEFVTPWSRRLSAILALALTAQDRSGSTISSRGIDCTSAASLFRGGTLSRSSFTNC